VVVGALLQLNEEGLDSAKVMRIVSHPVRMRIIELLAVRPMSWKELSGEVGVRTGSLYHHLDTLERIVARDSDRRYTLTKLGKEIFEELADGKKTPAQSMQGIERAMKRRTAGALGREVFAPRALILLLTSTRARGVGATAAVSVVALGLLLLSGDGLVLFSFSPSGGSVFTLATYVASLAGLVLAAYAGLAVAFKQRGDPTVLATSTALSFIPVCVFGAVMSSVAAEAPPAGSALSVLTNGEAVTVLFAFFQAWGAGIMGAGMSVASGLRLEKTLVLSLVVLYATMLVVLLQGGRLT
jgi:DNA-binding HxlR family transcriptional regulator